jgi:hypothetical protein
MTEPVTSPYLSLRQAVRPGILAHRLLAADAERAGQLVAECEELLRLTRLLLRAAGRARILGLDAADPGEHGAAEHVTGEDAAEHVTGEHAAEHVTGEDAAGEHGTGRPDGFLDAYADAGLAWAKVVGSSLVLAEGLLEAGAWADVRGLAGVLAEAGETGAAAGLRAQLGQAVLAAHRDQLGGISSTMPPEQIATAIKALRLVLHEASGEVNREVNRLLVPLAAAIHAVMRERDIDIPFTSRVEHIATGGVAKYPDIVLMSLDEIAAEFEGLG